MMKKRVLRMILVMGLLISALFSLWLIPAAAEDEPTFGTIPGTGISWSYNEESRHLEMIGSGAIPDYGASEESPWGYWSPYSIFIGEGITEIGDYAFESDPYVSSLSLPSTLKRIGSHAFSRIGANNNNGFLYVKIPNGVTVIEDSAFRGSGMVSLQLPDGLQTVGDSAFAELKLLSIVKLPGGIENMGESLFYGCKKLEIIVVSDGIKQIPHSFAQECIALYTVELPSTLEAISDSAFSYSSLQTITIPGSVHTIGDYIFLNSGLEEIIFEDGDLTVIPDSCFQNCQELHSVTLPNGLKTIERNAFQFCKNLSFIELPDSLTTINSGAFSECGLQTVVFPEHFETLEATGAFMFTGLKGAYFKGSGINTDQSENSRRHNQKLFGEVDEDFAIYTVPGQTGWTGIDYEGCSDTTWYSYPLRSWDGKNINRVSGWNSVEDYYELGTQRIFQIMVAGHTSYPLPVGFTITVGDQTYVTQAQSTTIDIPADSTEDIVISKDGYHTFTLPAGMVRKYNFITMWKDDGNDTPVILGAYLRPTQSVFNWSQTVKEGSFDTYAFYSDVLWRDGSETGNLYLKQGDRSYLLVENGYTKIQPGMIFNAEGKEIYLEAVSEKGSVTRIKTRLTVQEYPPKMDIQLGDNTESGNTGTGCEALEQVKLDFNLNTGMFPMTVKLVDNKIIGTIGMDLNANSEDVEYYFLETKELVDKVKEGTLNECEMGEDIFTRAKNLFGKKTADGKPLFPDNYVKFGVDAKVEVLGYFEGKYVQNTDGSYKIDWDQTKFAVKFTGAASYEQQYMWMVGPVPIPVYWMVSLEAQLETALKLYQRDGDTESFQAPAMEFTAGIGLKAKAMTGIKSVFGLGVQANANLEFSLPNLNTMELENKEYIRYTGDTYGYGMLLDNEARLFTIHDGMYYFYYDGAWFPEQDSIHNNPLSLQSSAYQRIARPDPAIESEFFAGESSSALFSLQPGEGTSIKSKELKTNTYRNSQPQYATLPDGTQVIVWVEANGALETQLYYSVKESATWTQPKVVDTDDLSDDMPVLCVVENSLYLLWAESQEVRTADQNLADIYAGLQVSCAKLNGNVFEDLGTVGQNDVMDRFPVLTEIHETPVLLWVSGSFDAYDLWGAVRNGSSWESKLLYEDLRDVDGMDLLMTADGAELALTQCPDGETLSASAKELFTAALQMNDDSLQITAVTQKTDNDLPDTYASYVNSLLYWSQMGNLQNETGRVLCEQIGADAQILSRPGQNTAVVWTELMDDQTSRFLAVFPEYGSACELVELARSTGWVQSWSGTLDSGGKICLAVNELELTETAFEFGQADLTVYTITTDDQLRASDLYVDPFTVVPGGLIRAWVTVTNEGSKTVSATSLRTYFDSSTKSAGTVQVPELDPGESMTLEFSCTMPAEGAQTLKVASSASAEGPICSFKTQDISVEQVSALSDGTTTTVTAFVINRGMTDTEAFPVCLERSEKATEENLGSNRTVLGASQTVPALKPQEICLVTFTTDQLQDGDQVYVCADVTALDDNIRGNNEGFGVVQSFKTEQLEVSASVTEQTQTETVVQVFGSGDGECLVATASYAGGKMLDAETTVILSASNTITTEDLHLQGSGATEVRVFVLKNDHTFSPLKPVQIIPLTN